MALDTFTKIFSPADDVRVIYRREGPSLTGAVETADVPLHKRAVFIVRNGGPKGSVSHVLLQLCFSADKKSDEHPSSIMLARLPLPENAQAELALIPFDSKHQLWARELGAWLGPKNRNHTAQVLELGNSPLDGKNIDHLQVSIEELPVDNQCKQQCHRVLGIFREALQSGHIQFDTAALQNVFAPVRASPGHRGPG